MKKDCREQEGGWGALLGAGVIEAESTTATQLSTGPEGRGGGRGEYNYKRNRKEKGNGEEKKITMEKRMRSGKRGERGK